MADFLAIVSFIAFIAAFLGYIWCLERVWPSSKVFCSAFRSWCSSTWVLRCSSPSGS